jgi:hypothetical protein
MTNETTLEIFDHLFSLLEAQETQSAAMLQFIKDKGIGSDKELAPYLDQAGNASSVRWRAARVRINYLLSSTKAAEKAEEKKESAQQDAAPVANKDRDEKESKGQQSEKPGHDQRKKQPPRQRTRNLADPTKQSRTNRFHATTKLADPTTQSRTNKAPRNDQGSRGDKRGSEQRSKSQAG